MLFLSNSLRKHMDGLLKATSGSASASASASAAVAVAVLPSVTAWFHSYDKLLKRLSVAHLAQLVNDVTLAGALPQHAAAPGFSVQPTRAELRNRLEVAQSGMRCMEQLMATNNNAPSSAAPYPLHRSPSTDLNDGSAAALQLSPELQARCLDDLASAHAFLCIVCAVFDIGCLNDTEFWLQLIRTGGRSHELRALMRRIILALPSTAIQPKDCQRMLDAIRMQKDSVEFRSQQAKKLQAEEEEADPNPWQLFPTLLACVREYLQPSAYEFEFASFTAADSLDFLTNASALCRLAVASSPTSLPALLRAFSSHLSEERNIQLFQLLLQFLTTPPESVPAHSISAQMHFVRTQLYVLQQLDELATATPQRSSITATPLHGTLREQLEGSAQLQQQLQRSLQIHLMLLRCAVLADTPPGACSLSTLAARFESPHTRSSAVEATFKHFEGAGANTSARVLCTSVAAVLVLCGGNSMQAATQIGNNDDTHGATERGRRTVRDKQSHVARCVCVCVC